MDFGSITSALGLGGEFSTPVGALIEKGTSESLANTDWALNMQICDEVGMWACTSPCMYLAGVSLLLHSDIIIVSIYILAVNLNINTVGDSAPAENIPLSLVHQISRIPIELDVGVRNSACYRDTTLSVDVPCGGSVFTTLQQVLVRTFDLQYYLYYCCMIRRRVTAAR